MKNIGQHLKDDYEYSKKFYAEHELFFAEKQTVNIDEILRAHYLITDYFEHSQIGVDIASFYGLLNPHMLGSAFSRQFVQYGNHKKYTSGLELCATLFYGLVMDHAFHDGNKRTALLTLLYHLYKNGRVPSIDSTSLENLTVNIASNAYEEYSFFERYKDEDDKEVKMIVHYLKRNTRNRTGSYRSINFQELANNLRRHDVEMTAPDKNFVDFIYLKRDFLGKIKKTRITTISCPGLKRQVSHETVKRIVAEYKRITGHEIDVNVVYQNSEPMYKMIQEFEGPLMRLKDR